MNPKILRSHCAAEMLCVELSLPNMKKICITTCYRVGTLGISNHSEIHRKLSEISKNRKIKHNIIVGDFNLDTIDWDSYTPTNNIHKMFLDTFLDVGLSQLITQPTHDLGNTLDLLLTDCPDIIYGVQVSEPNEFVNSDHSSITFTIKEKVPRLVPKKRKIYNYNKADWNSLNSELRYTNWNYLLDGHDPDTAWLTFKHISISLKPSIFH